MTERLQVDGRGRCRQRGSARAPPPRPGGQGPDERASTPPRRLRPGAQVPPSHGPEGPAPAPCAHRRRARRCTWSRHTLDKMARGGIYDHLGGGFARYSTDERWLVPHFEKMLYDNALLASVYLEAFQVDRRPGLRPGGARDARLRPPPDDRRGGRVLLDRGRRQRGRGGEVLRLDAGRDPSGPGSRSRQDVRLRLRRHGVGQLGGPEHPQPAPPDQPGGEAARARRGRS